MLLLASASSRATMARMSASRRLSGPIMKTNMRTVHASTPSNQTQHKLAAVAGIAVVTAVLNVDYNQRMIDPCGGSVGCALSALRTMGEPEIEHGRYHQRERKQDLANDASQSGSKSEAS